MRLAGTSSSRRLKEKRKTSSRFSLAGGLSYSEAMASNELPKGMSTREIVACSKRHAV